MLADFLTKHVDAATILTCMSGLGLKFQSGDSKLVLKASARNAIHSEEFEGDLFSLGEHVSSLTHPICEKCLTTDCRC